MRKVMETIAKECTHYCGSSAAFITAILIVIIWIFTGPIFNYSDTWQLVINTGTTIITFLMVFLIQRTQNKDSFALHMKLNELIAAHDGASNKLINVENLTEDEIIRLHRRYIRLAEKAKETTITHPCTVEDISDDD